MQIKQQHANRWDRITFFCELKASLIAGRRNESCGGQGVTRADRRCKVGRPTVANGIKIAIHRVQNPLHVRLRQTLRALRLKFQPHLARVLGPVCALREGGGCRAERGGKLEVGR